MTSFALPLSPSVSSSALPSCHLILAVVFYLCCSLFNRDDACSHELQLSMMLCCIFILTFLSSAASLISFSPTLPFLTLPSSSYLLHCLLQGDVSWLKWNTEQANPTEDRGTEKDKDAHVTEAREGLEISRILLLWKHYYEEKICSHLSLIHLQQLYVLYTYTFYSPLLIAFFLISVGTLYLQ